MEQSAAKPANPFTGVATPAGGSPLLAKKKAGNPFAQGLGKAGASEAHGTSAPAGAEPPRAPLLPFAPAPNATPHTQPAPATATATATVAARGNPFGQAEAPCLVPAGAATSGGRPGPTGAGNPFAAGPPPGSTAASQGGGGGAGGHDVGKLKMRVLELDAENHALAQQHVHTSAPPRALAWLGLQRRPSRGRVLCVCVVAAITRGSLLWVRPKHTRAHTIKKLASKRARVPSRHRVHVGEHALLLYYT